MSFIAWLDTSLEQQRRAQEIISLFSDKGTIDDLGIGQIRDALGDRLFPGSSTLHTRARYFLFVPWTFQIAAATSRPRGVLAHAEDTERSTLVSIKNQHGVLPGLIGGLVGKNVKTLPSQIYWTALRTYGILVQPVSRQQIGLTLAHTSEARELVERSTGPWVATIPKRPSGFPWEVDGGFDLTHEEAGWLQERIVLSAPNSVLGWISRVLDSEVIGGFDTPWDALRGTDLPREQAVPLRHAELFAMTMRGAAWVYNVLLAEAYEKGKWTPEYGAVDVDHYRSEFDTWVEQMRDLQPHLKSWDLSSFWRTLGPEEARIGIPTTSFVRGWISAVVSGAAVNALSDPDLRALVSDRERAKKGPLAMLANSARLSGWTGNSGTRLLNFRWGNVTGVLRDIREGLHGAGA